MLEQLHAGLDEDGDGEQPMQYYETLQHCLSSLCENPSEAGALMLQGGRLASLCRDMPCTQRLSETSSETRASRASKRMQSRKLALQHLRNDLARSCC